MKTVRGLLVVSSALLIACGQRIEADNTTEASRAEPLVKASPVTLDEPAPIEPSFKTTLYSEHDAEITARTEGVIRSVAAELGDAVSAGAALAVLEDEREAAAVQSAQAALELARSERARARALRTSEMITQAELDAAVYKEKAAEAALRTAQVELGYTRVRAPFAGRVSQRFVRVGQTVRAGEPLYRVTAPSPLRAALRLPEQQAGALSPGAAVSLAGEDGSIVSGKVMRVSPAVDPASGTIEVLIDVAKPRNLRPGSAVTLQLDDARTGKAAQ